MGKPASDKQLIHMLMDEPLLKRLDDFRIKMKAALDKGLAPKPAAKKEQ